MSGGLHLKGSAWCWEICGLKSSAVFDGAMVPGVTSGLSLACVAWVVVVGGSGRVGTMTNVLRSQSSSSSSQFSPLPLFKTRVATIDRNLCAKLCAMSKT